MKPMATHLWIIDKLHEDKIVLVCDDGRAAAVPPASLPPTVETAMVLRVDSDAHGEPDWGSAAIDTEETERRRRRSAEMVRKLRQSDQHGFIHPPE